MLSRIFRAGEVEAAEPIDWRPIGSGAAPSPQPHAAAAAHHGPLDHAAALASERAETARLQARVAELERLVEQRAKEAHQKGAADARAAAESQAAARVQAEIERLAQSAAQLAALRPKLRAEAEADLVHLAIAVARRILNRELASDPQAITALVDAALAKLRAQEPCRIRVHPDHKAALAAGLASAGARIEVVGDPALSRGDAILETARGDLDASAETQLAEIERGLTDRLQQRRHA